MSVRYYSTKVEPEDSMAEVVKLIRKHGGNRFEQFWDPDTREVVGVRFNLPAGDEYLAIVLRPQVTHLTDLLREEHGIRDREQVLRVAWRQMKGILEGILLAADSGMFDTAQLFLGMGETPAGTTYYDELVRGGIKMLGSGD